MNVYKVTYILDGEEHYDHIVERTEKAAQKRLKGIHKAAEITDTELTSTDAPATKEQERETLERIRELLDDLGPQSYLRTAFEGCLEDADQNIEDDAAYSYKARYELAEEKLGKEKEAHGLTARSLEHAKEALQRAEEALAEARKHIIPEWLRRDLWMMTTDEAEKSRARMAEAADKMAVGADNPACVLFKDSVALYRAEKQRAETMEQRADALDAIEPEHEEGGAA